MLNLLALDIANVAKTVLGIGGLIFVHELGHFLVGRWCGVRAEAFSIGFGPVLAKWQPGETEYRLSAIPLGGYVKFLGENPDERGELDPRSFHAATYPRKVAIMLAGVTMNVVVAFVLFATAFTAGVEMPSPVVGRAEAGYPAWEHGIEPGDRIVEIDGHRIVAFDDVGQECALLPEVEFVVERDGVRLPPMTIPTIRGDGGVRRIGITPRLRDDGVLHVESGGAADRAGLRSGDRVVAVAGAAVSTVQEAIEKHAASTDTATWTVERDGARVEAPVPVGRKWVIGIVPDGQSLVSRKGSAAASMGFVTGDRPVSVGGVQTPSWVTFADALDSAAAGVPVVVRRGTGDVTLAMTPQMEATPAGLWIAPSSKVLVAPTASGGAAAAGLPPGAEILTVDGREIVAFGDVRELVAAAGRADRPVRISWRAPDGTERRDVEVRPERIADAEQIELGIGVSLDNVLVQGENVFAAAALGLDRTHRWVMRILQTLRSLFTGGVSAKKLQGPVALARATYQTADQSFTYLLMFLGMISMNLAVLNVLPIPLLDGGQLALITAEKIRGRPLPERLLSGIQYTGLAILLSFMLYVVVNDIRNL